MTTRSTARSTTARATGAALVILLGLAGTGLALPVGAFAQDGRTGPPTPDESMVWPLTGVPTDEVAHRPAVSVKIENSTAARPQVGLVEADIVWEEVVEGGITRFVATYHSDIPDVVEPVRSVRPMDPAIVAPLDGVLAFSGGQRPFVDAVEQHGTQTISMDDGDPGFTRDPARPAPHDVIGSMWTFLAQADDERTSPPPAQFRYARAVGEGTAPRTGDATLGVDVRLSSLQRATWTWDQRDLRYLRSEGTGSVAPSVAADGTRHSARNVLVLSTEVDDSDLVDSTGDPIPEHRLAGSGGIGTLLSTGHSTTVRWSKADHGSPLVITSPDGTQAELDPGTTWIELVPARSGSWTIS